MNRLLLLGNLIFKFFVLGLIILPLINLKSIMNSYDLGPQIFLYFVVGLMLILITFLFPFFKRVEFKVNIIDCLVLILASYQLINGLQHQPNKIISYGCVVLVYFINRIIISINSSSGITRFLKILIPTVIIYLCVYCLLQLYNILPSNSAYFKLTGPFTNPALCATTLIALSPFCITNVFFTPQLSRHNHIRKLSVLALVLVILVLPLTYDRAAWIGILISTVWIIEVKFQLIKRLKTKKHLYITFFLLLFFLSIILFALYILKPESADGRLLIWKISFDMIKHHPFCGIGYGDFEHQYNLYQASYFSTRSVASHEVKLAEVVNYPYDIFIEILCEEGIIGFVLFVLLLILNVKLIYKKLYIISDDNYLHVAIFSCLISVLFCGLFAYPFDILYVQIIIYLFLGILASDYNSLFKITWRNIFFRYIPPAFFLFAGVLLIRFSIIQYTSYSKWEKVEYFHNDSQRYLIELDKLSSLLSYDGYYLASLGNAELKAGNYGAAIKVLENAKEKLSDSYLYCNLGLSYEMSDKNDLAEKNLLLAGNMSPHMIYPKYLLVKFYLKCKQIVKAKKVYQFIISSKAKIPSHQDDKYRYELSMLMNNYH